MTTPPFLKAALVTALSALFFVAVAPAFAEDEDEEVEPVKVIPLIDTLEKIDLSYEARNWRDTTIEKGLVAPYTAERYDKGIVSVDLGLDRNAPRQMTFFGKGARTWFGRLRKVEWVCQRYCDDEEELCHWEGRYDVPGAKEPNLALAGRLRLRDLQVPSFQQVSSDVPACPNASLVPCFDLPCQDAVWGPFRTRVCQLTVKLAYNGHLLLEDFTEYSAPTMRITHDFHYGQIDYYLVRVSAKMTTYTGLLYLSPAGWVFLFRDVEPIERLSDCC